MHHAVLHEFFIPHDVLVTFSYFSSRVMFSTNSLNSQIGSIEKKGVLCCCGSRNTGGRFLGSSKNRFSFGGLEAEGRDGGEEEALD